MIDIEKAIKEAEEKQGVKFTEEQIKIAEGLGMIFNSFHCNKENKVENDQ